MGVKLKTVRDCYATNLKRAGVPKDNIGEMMGHSNSVVTEPYLASLDIEKTQEINQHILWLRLSGFSNITTIVESLQPKRMIFQLTLLH